MLISKQVLNKYIKVDEQNSTCDRYITESQEWCELIWKVVRNGLGRCADEIAVVGDVTSRYRGAILYKAVSIVI